MKEYLTRDDYDPRQVIRMHLEEIDRKAAELAGSRNDCVGFERTRPDGRGVRRSIPANH